MSEITQDEKVVKLNEEKREEPKGRKEGVEEKEQESGIFSPPLLVFLFRFC